MSAEYSLPPEPVSKPTVTFVAVAEQTSAWWFCILLGVLGAIPFYAAIAFVAWVLR